MERPTLTIQGIKGLINPRDIKKALDEEVRWAESPDSQESGARDASFEIAQGLLSRLDELGTPDETLTYGEKVRTTYPEHYPD